MSNTNEQIARARDHTQLLVEAGSEHAAAAQAGLARIEQLDLTTIGGQREANTILSGILDTDNALVSEMQENRKASLTARNRRKKSPFA